MNDIVMYMYYLLKNKQNARTNNYNLHCNDPKFSDRQVWANSADPDQTADQRLDFDIPSASFERIILW